MQQADFPDSRWLGRFRRALRIWFEKHRREMPWRGSRDPYRIWVSEIMLQQTTTQTVRGYFDRFLARFPDVETLAAADLAEVNRLWEGLGYYRRAAQLHRAARVIVEKYGGCFPETMENVLALPGVGRYTAGAVLSIARNDRLPILEANTIRLHARLLALRDDPTSGPAQKRLWEWAERVLPQPVRASSGSFNCGDFNQALMDLGSMVCTPAKPNCPKCPVFSLCRTGQAGLQEEIPYRKAKVSPEQRTELAVLVYCRGKVLMVQAPPGERCAGLWDFPRIDITDDLRRHPTLLPIDSVNKKLALLTGRRLALGAPLKTLSHSVTRYRITRLFHEAEDHGVFLSRKPENDKVESSHIVRWFTMEALRRLPLNSPARKLFATVVEPFVVS